MAVAVQGPNTAGNGSSRFRVIDFSRGTSPDGPPGHLLEIALLCARPNSVGPMRAQRRGLGSPVLFEWVLFLRFLLDIAVLVELPAVMQDFGHHLLKEQVAWHLPNVPSITMCAPQWTHLTQNVINTASSVHAVFICQSQSFHFSLFFSHTNLSAWAFASLGSTPISGFYTDFLPAPILQGAFLPRQLPEKKCNALPLFPRF